MRPFWECPWLHVSDWIGCPHNGLRYCCWRSRLAWYVEGWDPYLRAVRARNRGRYRRSRVVAERDWLGVAVLVLLASMLALAFFGELSWRPRLLRFALEELAGAWEP